jgi:thymidylate synthase (FAD)
VKINVLDLGYVQPVESWGSDESIIEAARMSTGKGFQGWETDAKLLAYLYNNKHATPFEMAGLIIEVKAPIFIFREWHRHRTQSYNEMSARYVPLPNENYMPSVADVVARSAVAVSTKNRQASGLRECHVSQAEAWLKELADLYRQAEYVYASGIEYGVPKELARLPVPVARYSRMRASANLRNWLAFLTLRMAPNAQQEIRQYANAVGEIIAERFPRTWQLFNAEQATNA